ncbi:uncharacterized protein CPUR_07217 [Claviceps purpurea 20.1]|uniref:F-box domain-containing protein n=1 Tax=Claviceps purpurea (strain 20.1) TaxID=1111077 RepID=M1WF19_CLAP2|nr:uncharacterized protein CPUR_07217 [Claviceps purpurea 20.1]
MSPTPTQSREIHKRSLSDTLNSPPNCKRAKQSPVSVPASYPSRSRLSLQNLPLELLESIFLYSMNLALPRSSPLLGAKLSGKTTLLRVFMTAFHDIWDVTLEKYVLDSRPEWKKYWNYRPEWKKYWRYPYDKEPNEELQDEASIQADIDFILDAQQAWANKYAGGRSFDHVNDWGDLYLMDISHAPQSYQEHVLQHSLGEVTFDARACFEADYERALACRVSPDMFASAKLFELPDLNPPVAPVNLITGPWNEEQKRRLFWLVRAQLLYNIDLYPLYLGSQAVQVRLACLDAAVISAEKLDPLIINCLLGCWLFVDLSQDAKHERLVKLCNRIDRGGEMLDMQILRFVVRQLDHKEEFMEYYFSM